MSPRPTRLLVVAGHDEHGRAGVDADREAARRFEVEAAFVVTAWTAQDDEGVRDIGARRAKDWLAEARSASGPDLSALKFGLLPGSAHVQGAARLIDELRSRSAALHVIVDPVLAASSGAVFLDRKGVATLFEELVPRRVVLTPNLLEAARLCGLSPEELLALDARVRAAKHLLELGAEAVLLKGGHASDDPVHDLVLERAKEPRWHLHPRVSGRGIRGSGCRYATAVAAQLARGASLADAAEAAGSWLAERIAAARPG